MTHLARLLMAAACVPSALPVVVPSVALDVFNRAWWLVGPDVTRDVTDQPGWHGGFKVGTVYRLKHGAYLNRAPSALVRPYPPDCYGGLAIAEAARRFGDPRKAPADFSADVVPEWRRERNLPPLPAVEGRAAGDPLPPGAIDVVAAGTRLRLTRVLVTQGGDSTTFSYRGEFVDGPREGELLELSGLSNYGQHFDFEGSGYSPNPLMLGAVETPATAPTTAPSGPPKAR